MLSGGVLLQFSFSLCSKRQQKTRTVRREEKGEAERPSFFTPYDSPLTPTPHAAVNSTASDLLSLCVVRIWKRIYDKGTVAAVGCCSARTRSGIVHPVFLPHGLPVSFE